MRTGSTYKISYPLVMTGSNTVRGSQAKTIPGHSGGLQRQMARIEHHRSLDVPRHPRWERKMAGSGCGDSSWKAVESYVTSGFHNPPRPSSYVR